MICTVTMNPALDYIVFLPELKRGEINRASRAGHAPGREGNQRIGRPQKLRASPPL